MNKVTSKKGISMVTLVAMIVIMAILVSTVVITGTNAIESAKKSAFAQELMLVQNAVNSYYMSNNTLPLDNQMTVDLSKVNAETKSDQFAGETITGDKVTLYILDLNEIGIDNVTRGNRANGDTDVYAISDITKKVYYVAGEKLQGKTYYTLNNDLKGLVSLSNVTTNSTTTDGIMFSQDKLEWTKEGIVSNIKIPSSYTIGSVTVTNGMSAIIDNLNTTSGYTTYNVNEAKLAGNYTVTINYTKDGKSNRAVFEVDNYDNVAPSIMVGTQTYVKDESNKKVTAYINDVIGADILSGVKVIKYESEKIASDAIAGYFKTSGKVLNSSIIPLEAKQDYTIYVEDKAGNITSKYVTVDANILNELKLYK